MIWIYLDDRAIPPKDMKVMPGIMIHCFGDTHHIIMHFYQDASHDVKICEVTKRIQKVVLCKSNHPSMGSNHPNIWSIHIMVIIIQYTYNIHYKPNMIIWVYSGVYIYIYIVCGWFGDHLWRIIFKGLHASGSSTMGVKKSRVPTMAISSLTWVISYHLARSLGQHCNIAQLITNHHWNFPLMT